MVGFYYYNSYKICLLIQHTLRTFASDMKDMLDILGKMNGILDEHKLNKANERQLV